MLLVLATACVRGTTGAAQAVEDYLNALVTQDEARLVNLSCADWEASARSELDSFTAVTVELQDLVCQESRQDGDFTLVACNGKIVANYGNEVLEINMADRIYLAADEGGEWRMCGYR